MKQAKRKKTKILLIMRGFLSKKRKKKSPQIAIERSKKARNPLIVFANFIFMLAVFCLALGALALYSVKNLYERPGHMPQNAALLVPAGAGVSAIANLLAAQGFISNAQVFIYGTYLENKAGLLKAGEYEIPAQASMREIADILVAGRALQYSLTIPEGMTVAQIAAKIAAEPLLTGDLPETLPPEGSLLTNTVKFTRGAARREILRRLNVGQAHLVEKIWAQRAAGLPLKKAGQLVILASIIEKETGLAAERPRIAAVFYNRLKKNMRLQSDPTVLYGLFGSAGKPANRPIYRSDLEKDTPYNTYKIFGLPPAPICNPGRDSLLAAANPPQTEDLYFVADGAGGHIFAKSLNEHNSNVAKWRALRQMRQEEDEKTAGEKNVAIEPQEEEAVDKPALAPPPREETESSAAPAAEEEKPARQADQALPYAPFMQKTLPFSQSGSGLIKETP